MFNIYFKFYRIERLVIDIMLIIFDFVMWLKVIDVLINFKYCFINNENCV